MNYSVIVCAFNAEKYIEETLDSIMSQEKTNNGKIVEVIVVNDGSSDSTENIVRKFPRATLINQGNRGIERAANVGLSTASADYLVRVDSDDKLKPEFIRSMTEFISEVDSAEPCFFYSNYYDINAISKVIKVKSLPEFDVEEIKRRGDFLATGTILDSRLIKMFGSYDTSMTNSGLENYELILRFVLSGIRGYRKEAALFEYRRHDLSLSAMQTKKIRGNGQVFFDRMGLGMYGVNDNHPYGLKL